MFVLWWTQQLTTHTTLLQQQQQHRFIHRPHLTSTLSYCLMTEQRSTSSSKPSLRAYYGGNCCLSQIKMTSMMLSSGSWWFSIQNCSKNWLITSITGLWVELQTTTRVRDGNWCVWWGIYVTKNNAFFFSVLKSRCIHVIRVKYYNVFTSIIIYLIVTYVLFSFPYRLRMICTQLSLMERDISNCVPTYSFSVWNVYISEREREREFLSITFNNILRGESWAGYSLISEKEKLLILWTFEHISNILFITICFIYIYSTQAQNTFDDSSANILHCFTFNWIRY